MSEIALEHGWKLVCEGNIHEDEPKPCDGSMSFGRIKFFDLWNGAKLELIDDIFTFEFVDQNDDHRQKVHYLELSTGKQYDSVAATPRMAYRLPQNKGHVFIDTNAKIIRVSPVPAP